jgi:hypothetical protein
MPKIVKPIGVDCFRCKSKFTIKYNPGKKEYSLKNTWSYWTEIDETETVKNDKICDACLKDLYLYHKWEFWSQVKSAKKRGVLRNYIYLGII